MGVNEQKISTQKDGLGEDFMNRIKQEIVSSAIDVMVETASDTVKKRYRFGPNFIGFSGHFPGYPILPAFVQILTAQTLVEEQKGHPLELAGIENAKFHIQLRPDQDIDVECRHRQIRGKLGCEARLKVDDGLASSFVMFFLEEAGCE